MLQSKQIACSHIEMWKDCPLVGSGKSLKIKFTCNSIRSGESGLARVRSRRWSAPLETASCSAWKSLFVRNSYFLSAAAAAEVDGRGGPVQWRPSQDARRTSSRHCLLGDKNSVNYYFSTNPQERVHRAKISHGRPSKRNSSLALVVGRN